MEDDEDAEENFTTASNSPWNSDEEKDTSSQLDTSQEINVSERIMKRNGNQAAEISPASPQYHTIFTPLADHDIVGSPTLSRNELSRSLSTSNLKDNSKNSQTAQSLPKENSIQSKESPNGTNILRNLTKETLIFPDSIQISLCAKQVFESYSMSLVVS